MFLGMRYVSLRSGSSKGLSETERRDSYVVFSAKAPGTHAEAQRSCARHIHKTAIRLGPLYYFIENSSEALRKELEE